MSVRPAPLSLDTAGCPLTSVKVVVMGEFGLRTASDSLSQTASQVCIMGLCCCKAGNGQHQRRLLVASYTRGQLVLGEVAETLLAEMSCFDIFAEGSA